MTRNKIILTRGIQGSGKSTWAYEWAREDPMRRIRVNNDDIRNMMGVYWQPTREPLITTILNELVKDAIKREFDVVVDNMNLNPKEWDRWNNIAQEVGADIEFKDFLNVPLNVCIERDARRERPIGAKVIKDTFNRYRKFILEQVNKAEAERLIKPNTNLPNAIIVDLDGTLCLNTNGRPFYGEGTAEGIKDDIEITGTCELVRSMKSQGTEIIIVTGREGTVEITSATNKWLKDHNIQPSVINFRGIGDYSAGNIYKEGIYNNFIKDKYNVLFVLEDSKKCVDMWRKNGLICLQPNEGNF